MSELSNKIKPSEILELIRSLPDNDKHIYVCPIDGKHIITSEIFSGAFAGRSFDGATYEDAAQQLIDYMYEHIGHNSMVGNMIDKSGFPDRELLFEYCKKNGNGKRDVNGVKK